MTLPTAHSRYEKRKAARTLTLYTLHDLTAQKRAEQAEREAKERYAEASAAKSVLINTMTHELRTPLNAVCGFADLIADSAMGPHEVPEYAEFGEMIRSGGKQLLGVINDMLLAARFQSNEVSVNTRRFELSEAVEAALNKAKARQAWTDPQLTVDIGNIPLDADYDLIVTALYHVIENAAKFSGASGKIHITTDEQAGTLTVSDNGPGLAGADPAVLTELFQQGDGSNTRSHEGCGLGLFLVKKICAAHGCPMTLEDGQDGGLDVRFDLSAIRAKSGATERAA